jgi:hypothetical protein
MQFLKENHLQKLHTITKVVIKNKWNFNGIVIEKYNFRKAKANLEKGFIIK